MSQFSFLQAEFSPVFDHARKAEATALSDPRSACFYARLALETAIKWMYEHDRTLRSPYDNALSALIHEGTFRALVGNALVTKARIIKDLGNRAVHDTRPVAPQAATTCCPGAVSFFLLACPHLRKRHKARSRDAVFA